MPCVVSNLTTSVNKCLYALMVKFLLSWVDILASKTPKIFDFSANTLLTLSQSPSLNNNHYPHKHLQKMEQLFYDSLLENELVLIQTQI